MPDHDAVVVGSGVNSLAAGALLARAGWSVCILERSDHVGGAILTAEITVPGFHHDVLSASHPLWVGGAAHAELGDELAARGLEYLNTDYPTATAFPDGGSAFLLRSADANAAELDRHATGDGEAWRAILAEFLPNADLSFGVLGTELWSKDGMALALKAYRRLGRRGLAELVGVEPVNRVGGEQWTMISSIPETVALLEEVDRPGLGIMFDVWHLWETPGVLDDIRAHADRFVGVHVCDSRSPTRGWADRVLPGDGIAPLPTILHALDDAGWDGFYDLEIFSDNGAFGNAYPDSLWNLPPDELVRRGRAQFLEQWT